MTLKDLLNKENIRIILQVASENGMTNVRVYLPTVPIEKNALNLLVDPENGVSSVRVWTYRWKLEDRLMVNINATTGILVSQFEFKRIIKVAVSIEDCVALEKLIEENDYRLKHPHVLNMPNTDMMITP